MIIAVAVIALVFAAMAYYRNVTNEKFPGENAFRLGSKLIEDGNFSEAESELRTSLSINPDHAATWQALGVALMQQQRFDDAWDTFNKAIEKDPDFAEAYANRGILNDRAGRYEEALNDYKQAIERKPELTKGPGWLDRFLHNESEKPPTILDRARYLQAELAKPESERLLKVPEMDAKQRMYKPK